MSPVHESYTYSSLPLPYDPIISHFTTHDIRFPTSLDKTGSDAMNAAGDYSAAYCLLWTSSEGAADGADQGAGAGEGGAGAGTSTSGSSSSRHNVIGHGMTFTIGRGNDLVCAAIPYYASKLVGRRLSSLVGEFGKTWAWLVSDSQVRWIGPEKGSIHLALGAVVNAIWDLWGKVLGKPVWQVVCEMNAEEVVRCCCLKYVRDVLDEREAVVMLESVADKKSERVKIALENTAVPAYTTSAGWLGYSREKMKRLLEETMESGYKHFKLKVGGSVEDDRQRLTIARDVIGYDKGNVLMVDANQVWDVPQAIEYMKELAEFKPWFIEEPTSPDDVLGHKTIREALKPLGIGVATGEMCQNRVMFKQLLQAEAIDACQVDACRLGGLNEVLVVLLLAKKLGVPVVPHSGGVGLPEYTQHVSTIDYVLVSGEKSILEYVDALHEHFQHPCKVVNGHYVTPLEPGYSAEMKPESLLRYQYPGEVGVSWWQTEEAKPILEGEKI